ncbi:TPA: SRPBCC family protein [Candidatus Saccharibacteria bacterium]|nr:SRPBCC family protein [Candidatus Saccharibacteria bacterium]HIO87774.1 SRPBCC family protein [Candidatus Saccharibacteria bacterium]
MTFEFSIDLSGTPQEVWDFFDDPRTIYLWQPTLTNMEPVQGAPGEVGSVTKLTYTEKNRTTVILEEVITKRPPEFLENIFTDLSGSIHNKTENYFETFFDQTTWRMVVEFEFNGFLMKLLSPLLKPSIKKRTLADMQRFKYAFENRPKDPDDDKGSKKPKKSKKKKPKKSKKKSKKKK